MKIALLVIAAAVVSFSGTLYAGDSIKPIEAGLEDRLYGCMEDSECPAALKIQLLNELYSSMGINLHQISINCSKRNYGGCVNPKSSEVKEWHRINDRMIELMASLEGSNSIIAKGNKENLKKK